MPAGRPREFDREKALERAMLLFWRKGFYATSVAELCKAIGVNTPSLYAAFGNKEKLYTETIGLYMELTQDLLWSHLENCRNAREGMHELLRATAKELTSTRAHPTGCFVTLATIDEDMPAAVAKVIMGARRGWLETIRKHIRKAIRSGELSSTTEVNGMARAFQAIVQSIGIQSHDGASRADMESLVDVAMAIWPETDRSAVSQKP